MNCSQPPLTVTIELAQPTWLSALLTAMLLCWLGTEIYYTWRCRLPAGANPNDRGSRSVLAASVVLSVYLGSLLKMMLPALTVTNTPLATTVILAGAALMAAGISLRWYAVRLLGRFFTFTVATQKDQRVVEDGPYRWIRHPSYTGGLVTILGFLLATANPAALLALVMPIAGYLYRISVEEKALAAELGNPYQEYMKRTSRLIPFLF